MTDPVVKAMNVKFRRSIFWIFIIFFAVLAPLLVLYTSGYRYSLETGQIVRAGVLSVVSDPRGVSIYVDDELEKNKSPAVVKRLMPGTYSLRLEKDGYQSWNGKIEIFSGNTTIVNTILLFLNSEPEMLFNKETENLTANPNGELIAYTVREEGWEEVWLYDLKNEEHKMIDQRIVSEEKTELLWSAGGEYLSDFNSDIGLYVFNKSGEHIDLDYSISIDIESVSWHPNNDNILFLASAAGLEKINLSSKSSELIENTDETSISLDASILNFFDDGTYTELMQLISDKPTLLALLPRSNYTIAERDGSYIILTDTKGRLILLDIHAEIPILLETQAKVYDWNGDKNLLVYSDGYEVNIYDPGLHTNEFITRQSSQIKSLLWHPSATSLLLQHQTDVIAYERYIAADSRKTFTLVNDVDEIKNIWVASDGQTLYYYAHQNGTYGLYKLELTKPFISL